MGAKLVSKGMPISQAMANATEKGVEKLNNKYIQDQDDCKTVVTFKKEGNDFICEIVIHIGHSTLKASSSTEDMYKSIGKAFNVMDRELRKVKEKLIGKRQIDDNEEVETCECNCEEQCKDCKC